MLHKRSENRFWRDRQKAERKQRISRSVHNSDWYPDLGRYRKGKIHDHIAKTNDAGNRSRGPMDGSRKTGRLAVTHERYGKKNYKPSDRRKVDAFRYQVSEIVG